MKKSVLGVLVGALAFYVWGIVCWMVLPFHERTFKTLPEETLITDTLKTVIPDAGLYAFPSMPIDTPNAADAWSERYMKGPTGLLLYSPGGTRYLKFSMTMIGFLIDLALAALTMVLLSLCRDRVKGIVARAALLALVGVIVAFAVHAPYWNWLHFPLSFTLVAVFDSIVGFLILGLAQAPFVRRD
jgi:hypothetical protein